MPAPRAIDTLNAAALVVALAAAGALGWGLARPPAYQEGAEGPAGPSSAMVVGADGVAVPVRSYHRIVSLVPALDDALADMGMLDRVAAVTGYAREHSTRHRQLRLVFGTVPAGASVEDLLAFHPDLVLAAAYSDPGRNARLRAAGVPVLDIGQERDAQESAESVRHLAEVCGDPRIGTEVADAFLRRFARVADPRLPRQAACYVGILAGRLEGGAAGTVYSEVLQAAGFADAAAAHGYHDYPDYRVEDLIAIAPEVIVTGNGMAAQIIALPGAERIPAVAQHRVLEIDRDVLSATGLGMLDAAEAIARAREASK
jgi:ABC-type hemin transport system substrate-binding protein